MSPPKTQNPAEEPTHYCRQATFKQNQNSYFCENLPPWELLTMEYEIRASIYTGLLRRKDSALRKKVTVITRNHFFSV